MRSFLTAFLFAALAAPMTATAENIKFAENFYLQVRDDDGNIVFSPISLKQAYALLFPGAAGATAKQMTKIFDFGDSLEAVSADFKRVNALAGASGAAELRIANRVWANQDLPIESGFTATLKRFFDASYEKLDVAAGEKPINTWIEEQTNRRIKNLLPAGAVTPQTGLIVANAVYFKAKWQTAFKPEATKPGPFKLESGKTVTTALMNGRPTGRVFKGNDLVAIALPYRDTDLQFIAVRPLESKLKVLEKNLGLDGLLKDLASTPDTLMDLKLPRFEFTQPLTLKPIFKRMGLKEPMDFSRVSKQGLSVDGYHKAFIKVDEDGTEAAAATAAVMIGTAYRESVKVEFDRPFLFFIVNPKTKEVIFQGRVADPTRK